MSPWHATGFVGAANCDIPCAPGRGEYRDQDDGVAGTNPIHVFFNCATRDNNEYFLWFGYENTNKYNVYVTKDSDNQVTHPVRAEVDGKPVRFRPGRHNYTMKIGWVVTGKLVIPVQTQ